MSRILILGHPICCAGVGLFGLFSFCFAHLLPLVLVSEREWVGSVSTLTAVAASIRWNGLNIPVCFSFRDGLSIITLGTLNVLQIDLNVAPF